MNGHPTSIDGNAVAAQPAARSAGRAGAPRILVADDQAHLVRVLRRALERKGYVVEAAVDGLEALEKLQTSEYAVLVTDLEMPRLSGRGLCEALQRECRGPVPLTVVVTGQADPALRAWAAGLEHTRFMEKPLSLRRLAGMIEEHLAAGSER